MFGDEKKGSSIAYRVRLQKGVGIFFCCRLIGSAMLRDAETRQPVQGGGDELKSRRGSGACGCCRSYLHGTGTALKTM